jgi:hypothetical protein
VDEGFNWSVSSSPALQIHPTATHNIDVNIRAREKLATAELELLSSTSDDTSELWTDEGIIRQPGHADTLELVVYEKKAASQGPNETATGQEPPVTVLQGLLLGDLGDACRDGVLEEVEENRFAVLQSQLQKLSPEQLVKQPPNLALNIHQALASSREIWMFAILGIVMQAVALVIPAVMTYHWKEKKDDKNVQGYAYPVFLAGSCAVIIGIALCSHIIEATTVEQHFRPKEPDTIETIFRLQVACNMGDQEFGTYVMMNEPGDDNIRTSRFRTKAPRDDPETGVIMVSGSTTTKRQYATTATEAADSAASNVSPSVATHNSRDASGPRKPSAESIKRRISKTSPATKADKFQMFFTICAIALCFAGFVCQFVGLRALHWSATIIQLGVTLFMTGVRAWVRRGISRKPNVFRLHTSNPNILAITVGTACQNKWADLGSPGSFAPFTKFRFLPSFEPQSITTKDPRIMLRHKLQSFTSDMTHVELAGKLSQVMGSTLRGIEYLFRHERPPVRFNWIHLINTKHGDERSQIHLKLSCYLSNSGQLTWEDGYDPLQSILSLWVHSKTHHNISYRCVDTFSGTENPDTRNWVLRGLTGFKRMSRPTTRLDQDPPECFGISFDVIQNSNKDRPGHILIQTDYSLPVQCALDIFSGLVSAVAEKLHFTNWVEDGIKLTAEQISEKLWASGLVNSKEDARMLIYSLFLRRRSLPSNLPLWDYESEMEDIG